MQPAPGVCVECGKGVSGQWRITLTTTSWSARAQRHIECWIKSKNVYHTKFYLQWRQRYRMWQKDKAHWVTKQHAWLELEDIKRISKLLFPDLIMPRSQRYEMGIEDIDKMTMKQLERELWSRNVPAQGKKQILQETLRDYMNGERCLEDVCDCQLTQILFQFSGGEYYDCSESSDRLLCYRSQRCEARKKRSELISFGFCRRMEKRHISKDLSTNSSQQEINVISTHVPFVLKQIIFKYYDMIMY